MFKKERNSSIELIKILAIFLIVIQHVCMTLNSKKIIDLTIATHSPINIVLMILAGVGIIGNYIFFIASSYFLLDSDEFKKGKWFSMLAQVWIISIIVFIISMIVFKGKIAKIYILKSLFPNTFANNWYITAYLLFYPIHGMLNNVIQAISQRRLLKVCIISFIIYFGFTFVYGELFFPSILIAWTVIYFCVAYFKIYLENRINTKKTICLLLICSVFMIFIFALSNLIALKIGIFNGKLLRWNTHFNPFYVMIAFSIFNLARKQSFNNKVINYLSGMSMLVYIIHENIILRTFLRPYFLNWIMKKSRLLSGNLILLVFVSSVCIYLISLLLSSIYKNIFGKMELQLSKLFNNFFDLSIKRILSFFLSI